MKFISSEIVECTQTNDTINEESYSNITNKLNELQTKQNNIENEYKEELRKLETRIREIHNLIFTNVMEIDHEIEDIKESNRNLLNQKKVIEKCIQEIESHDEFYCIALHEDDIQLIINGIHLDDYEITSGILDYNYNTYDTGGPIDRQDIYLDFEYYYIGENKISDNIMRQYSNIEETYPHAYDKVNTKERNVTAKFYKFAKL